VAALHPLPNYLAEILVGVAVMLAVIVWRNRCHPVLCRVLTATLIGLVLGAAVVALLLLFGLLGATGQITLAQVAVAIGVVLIIGVWGRCFKL
jgi:hypothetical protein